MSPARKIKTKKQYKPFTEKSTKQGDHYQSKNGIPIRSPDVSSTVDNKELVSFWDKEQLLGEIKKSASKKIKVFLNEKSGRKYLFLWE